METLLQIITESLRIFKEASAYLLLGFLAAGIMRAAVKPALVARYFKRGRLRSVFYASLIGIPIPL